MIGCASMYVVKPGMCMLMFQLPTSACEGCVACLVFSLGVIKSYLKVTEAWQSHLDKFALNTGGLVCQNGATIFCKALKKAIGRFPSDDLDNE